MRISDWSSDVCSSDLPFKHGQIAREKTGTGVDFAGHQALSHKQVVRFERRDRAVMHRPFRRQHQPEQTDLLRRQHPPLRAPPVRSEEHTSELQSLMRISYAVFCLKKKKKHVYTSPNTIIYYLRR